MSKLQKDFFVTLMAIVAVMICGMSMPLGADRQIAATSPAADGGSEVVHQAQNLSDEAQWIYSRRK